MTNDIKHEQEINPRKIQSLSEVSDPKIIAVLDAITEGRYPDYQDIQKLNQLTEQAFSPVKSRATKRAAEKISPEAQSLSKKILVSFRAMLGQFRDDAELIIKEIQDPELKKKLEEIMGETKEHVEPHNQYISSIGKKFDPQGNLIPSNGTGDTEAPPALVPATETQIDNLHQALAEGNKAVENIDPKLGIADSAPIPELPKVITDAAKLETANGALRNFDDGGETPISKQVPDESSEVMPANKSLVTDAFVTPTNEAERIAIGGPSDAEITRIKAEVGEENNEVAGQNVGATTPVEPPVAAERIETVADVAPPTSSTETALPTPVTEEVPKNRQGLFGWLFRKRKDITPAEISGIEEAVRAIPTEAAEETPASTNSVPATPALAEMPKDLPVALPPTSEQPAVEEKK